MRECLKEIDPAFEKLVKMHQEKRPIFSRYQLEEQIDLIYEKKVPLKSGGSIFIEPTEALVSIEELRRDLNPHRVKDVEAVAERGVGVLESMESVVNQVLETIKREL